MDPLSIAASVLGIATAAGTAASGLSKLSSFRDAPVEVMALMNEVTDLRAVLLVIGDSVRLLQASDNAALSDRLEVIHQVLDRVKNYLQELDNLIHYRLLKPGELNEDGGPRAARRRWVTEKQHLARLQQHLRDSRSTLAVLLNGLNILQGQQTRADVLLCIQEVVVNETTQLNERFTELSDEQRSIQQTLGQVFANSLTITGDTSPHVETNDRRTMRAPQAASDQDFLSASVTQTGLATSQRILRVNATVARQRCDRFCRCQCHTRNTIKLPRWLGGAVGTLFYTYTGTPYFTAKPCNYHRCSERSSPSVQLTYFFPDWMLRRALSITSIWKDLGGAGASWTIRMPRRISDQAPIWEQIENGKLDMVEDNFRKGWASPFDIGLDGQTVLSYAFLSAQVDLVIYLLQTGADPCLEDNSGESFADLVVQRSLDADPETAQFSYSITPYLEHIDIWGDLQLTTLHKIILDISNTDLASQLELDSSALNKRDRWGRTPLYWAAIRRDYKTIDLLLYWDADVHMANNRGRTPLHAAAESGCVESLSMLLDRGASARCIDLDGYTPLHLVASAPHKRTEIAAALLRHDAKIDAEDQNGRTPLAWAVRNEHQDLTLEFLQYGADIEHRGGTGNSAVMEAIISDHPCLVRLLIGNGAKLDVLDCEGSNVLHLCAMLGSVEIMNILADAEIQDVEVHGLDDYGDTPLDCFELYRTRFYAGIVDLDKERPQFERLLASVQEIWYDCEG